MTRFGTCQRYRTRGAPGAHNPLHIMLVVPHRKFVSLVAAGFGDVRLVVGPSKKLALGCVGKGSFRVAAKGRSFRGIAVGGKGPKKQSRSDPRFPLDPLGNICDTDPVSGPPQHAACTVCPVSNLCYCLPQSTIGDILSGIATSVASDDVDPAEFIVLPNALKGLGVADPKVDLLEICTPHDKEYARLVATQAHPGIIRTAFLKALLRWDFSQVGIHRYEDDEDLLRSLLPTERTGDAGVLSLEPRAQQKGDALTIVLGVAIVGTFRAASNTVKGAIYLLGQLYVPSPAHRCVCSRLSTLTLCAPQHGDVQVRCDHPARVHAVRDADLGRV
jgi:hypothetical protein